MKRVMVFCALLFISAQHLSLAQSERRSAPPMKELVFGNFFCFATTAGDSDNILSATLSASGSIFGGQKPTLSQRVLADDAVQVCDDAAMLIKAKAESSGCVAAISKENYPSYALRGTSFSCVGGRSEVVSATGEMGEELLRFLDSLETDQ